MLGKVELNKVQGSRAKSRRISMRLSLMGGGRGRRQPRVRDAGRE